MVQIWIFSFFIFLGSWGAEKFTVMTHNVENLFDTKHDSGKTDFAYLPLKDKNTKTQKDFCKTVSQPHWKKDCFEIDWSEKNLKNKISELKNTHLQVNGGNGADILFLQEIENMNVLNSLNESYGSKKYPTVVLIEGKDLRGIDVAVLSRFPVVGKPELHSIKFQDVDKGVFTDSRGILEVTLKLPDGSLVTIFSNHFPSPYHGYKTRIDAFKSLTSFKKTLPEDRLAIAAGDFNVPWDEDEKHGILKTYVAPYWLIAHKIYCEACIGTEYYSKNKTWSFFDMIFLSKNFMDEQGWELNKKTITVVKGYKNQLKSNGTPKRFDFKDGTGVSDHLPVYMEFIKR